MTPNDAEVDIHRANDAAYILGHRLVVEAMNAMRADIYGKIESTNWRQRAAREALYQQLVACNNFEAQFRYHVENGKVAKSWLEQWRAAQDLKRSRRKA